MGKKKYIRNRDENNDPLSCRVDGCARRVISRGLCSHHHLQAKRGELLLLRGSTKPSIVSWVVDGGLEPPPQPHRFGLVLPTRPKWSYEPALEKDLIVEQEKLDRQSEGNQGARRP